MKPSSNNDSDFKFLGPQRSYFLNDLIFKKKCETRTEHENEKRGLEIAHNVGISTPILKGEESDWLVYGKLNLPRLDQKFYQGLQLNLVERAGELISTLHHHTLADFKPVLKIPYQRILHMFLGLYRLGDFPDQFFKTTLGLILDRLEQYASRDKACYIHGDFLPQNIFVDIDLIIFDWEYSCYSDPAYDLATFMSFMLQFIAKNGMSYSELVKCEAALISGYSKNQIMDKEFINRVYFYKIFDTHSMYWLYLVIISELARLEQIPNIYMCSENDPTKRTEFVTVLHELGFKLKPKSILRLLDMIGKNPEAFSLLPFPEEI